MFSRVRRHLTYANMAATLALLFAMSGGALAAGHYLISSTKQVSPKVLKQLKGARGPAGAAGAAGAEGKGGATGPQGPEGKAGADGTNGASGTSVTSAKLSAGNKECPDGGSEFTSASGKSFACNGATGYTETLPPGKSEMGMWALSVPPANPVLGKSQAVASISFVIPLESAPTAHYLKDKETPTSECPGTAEEPKAEPGQLCMYASEEFAAPSELLFGTATYGAILSSSPLGEAEPGGVAVGSWAVTAEK
jgi:hypothetical protein